MDRRSFLKSVAASTAALHGLVAHGEEATPPNPSLHPSLAFVSAPIESVSPFNHADPAARFQKSGAQR
jgi:hypothetical protein